MENKSSVNKPLCLELVLAKLEELDEVNVHQEEMDFVDWHRVSDGVLAINFRGYKKGKGEIDDEVFQRYLLKDIVRAVTYFSPESIRTVFDIDAFDNEALNKLYQDLCEYRIFLSIKLFENSVNGGIANIDHPIRCCELAERAIKAYVGNDMPAYAGVIVEHLWSHLSATVGLWRMCGACAKEPWYVRNFDDKYGIMYDSCAHQINRTVRRYRNCMERDRW